MATKNKSTSKKTILLVEDEPVVALDQSGILKKHGYRVKTAFTGEDAIEVMKDNGRVDLVLMDINLGKGMDGTDTARRILEIHDVPIVFLTSHSEENIVERVKGITRYGYILKDSGEFVLIESIHMAFQLYEAHRLEKESREKYQQRSYELGERVKELNCLYNIASLVETPGISIDKILHGTVELIPDAWQYPDITCVRIQYNGNEYTSDNFHETAWKQASPILVNGENAGWVEVFYLEEKPEIDEGPFLKEERRLIYAISERLGRVIERVKVEKALSESEERLHQIVEHMPVMMDAMDDKGNILAWNRECERVTGYTANEIIGNPEAIKMMYPDDNYREEMMNMMSSLGYDFRDVETTITCKNGKKSIISWSNISGKYPIPGWYTWAVGLDVTESKRAIDKLKKSRDENELRQRLGFVLLTYNEEDVYAGILDILLEETGSRYGYVGYINDLGNLVCPTMTRDIWDQCRVPGKTNIFPRENWGGLWGQSLIEKRSIINNENLNPPEGHIPLTRVVAIPILSGEELVGQLVLADKKSDYTEQDREKLESIAEYLAPIIRGWVEKSRRDEEILRLLEEKEILLNEVHHRIKNDMSAIRSLLSLQASETENPEASATLIEARNRISVMGSIYDSLYRGRGFSSMNIKTFIKDLLSSLQQTYSGKLSVKISSDIEDTVIAAKQSFYVGIIVNELVTNCYKYAFTESGQGEVVVKVNKQDEKTLRILVKDTGKGLPVDIVEHETFGFGLKLVTLFIEQYKGSMDITTGNGTSIKILLPLLPVKSEN